MEAEQIIRYIQTAEKKTPVKVYFNSEREISFPNCKVFGNVVFGDWKDIEPVLLMNPEVDYEVENDCRNSAVPMLDLKIFMHVLNQVHLFVNKLKLEIMPLL